MEFGQILSATKWTWAVFRKKLLPGDESDRTAFKNVTFEFAGRIGRWGGRCQPHNMMPHTLLKLGLSSAVRDLHRKPRVRQFENKSWDRGALKEGLEPENESVLCVIRNSWLNVCETCRKASVIGLTTDEAWKELTIVVEDNGVRLWCEP